jgi:hypothetical protein
VLGRDQEALTHLRWCLQRKPNDEPLSDLFRAVMDRASRSETIALTDFAGNGAQVTSAVHLEHAADDGHSGVQHSDSSLLEADHRDGSLQGNDFSSIEERNR